MRAQLSRKRGDAGEKKDDRKRSYGVYAWWVTAIGGRKSRFIALFRPADIAIKRYVELFKWRVPM